MDSYQLTTRSQETLASAVALAGHSGHPHVEPLHLLVTLLAPTDGVPRPLIEAAGGDPVAVAAAAKAALARLDKGVHLARYIEVIVAGVRTRIRGHDQPLVCHDA